MSSFRMFQSALLVLTNPVSRILSNIPRVLTEATKHVQDTLYVHLAPGLDNSGAETLRQVPCTNTIDKVVTQLYSHAASHHQKLDLRVIIGNVGDGRISKARPGNAQHYNLSSQLVLVDSGSVERTFLTSYIDKYFVKPSSSPFELRTLEFPTGDGVVTDEGEELAQYDNSCLGGTFDRLHTGHKILLSYGAMLSRERLIAGVTDGKMNDSKLLPELMEPCAARISAVRDFLESVKPQLVYDVPPITDPYGPSVTDADIQSIIVSQETLRGGNAVNRERANRGMNELAVKVIDLVEDTHHHDDEEEKISSSSLRRRMLGTLLRQPKKPPSAPYIVGLTGGIASGKSSVCRRLEGLGAGVVDCDKLGHLSYLPEGAAYVPLVAEFGEDIVASDGTIDRRALGGKVFGNDGARQRLNHIVWPVIRDLALEKVKELTDDGHSVVVLDAAVLLEAGWDDLCHEVWTAVVPRTEAVKRIMERNKLSEEDSLKRIDAQMSIEARVSQANVVLCTLWEYSTTQAQVERAWKLLEDRIGATQKSM